MATVNPLLQQIDAIAKEKGVEPEIIISAVQDALEAAARKRYKSEALRARFNTETGQLELYAVKKIVDEVTDASTQISLGEAQQLYGDEAEVDMEIEFPRPTEDLGRIAAQTAKQVIFQKVREAERENVYAEYSQRVGEVVSGMVKRFENGDIIIELGRVEAQLPRKEQSRAENYAVGDRVRAVIRGVNRSAKGPQIVLSRTDPALLIKLFEQEVPEIYDGTVMIRGAVREAGDRAKVAVYSRERDVDPVGACVGMKGTRVQSIIRELRGEKIDIVEWSEDPILFVTNAHQPGQGPARVDRRRRRAGDGSDRRGQAAVAGDRQEGPERPARGEADRLEDRHQERRRKAPRSRSAARRARDRRARRRRRGRRGGAAAESRRGRRGARPAEATADAADGGAEAGDGRDAGRAEAARRRRPAATTPTSAEATPRRSSTAGGRRDGLYAAAARDERSRSCADETKRAEWPLFGFTRSRSCSTRRARK